MNEKFQYRTTLFTFDLPYILSNLFTHVKPVKVYVRTHLKITRQWKSTFTVVMMVGNQLYYTFHIHDKYSIRRV